MRALMTMMAAAAGMLPAQDEGVMIATPAAFTVRPGTLDQHGNPVDHLQVYAKKSGFERAPAESGRFSFASLFGAHGLEIDALSVGLDEISMNATRDRLVVPPDRWTALIFSIKGDPSPGTASGVIERERLRADGAGADLFTFLPLNVLSPLPPGFLGVTNRALDSTELELFDPASGTKGDIASVDVHLPAYHMDTGIVSQLPPPVVFFSVSNATLGNVPTPWWGGTGPSGATILRTCWNGTAWTSPRPAVTFFGLGLARDDDIDALAIEYDEGTNFEVVFSTTALTSVVTSQLMYVDLPPIGPCVSQSGPIVLMTADDKKVEDDLEKGDGDLDAVCFADPDLIVSQPGGCGTRFVWSFVIGTPRLAGPGAYLLPDPPFGPTLEASVFRDCPDLNRVQIRANMTGWPGDTPGDGLALAIAMIAQADATPYPWSPVIELGPILMRSALDPEGGPLSTTWRTPIVPAPVVCREIYLWTIWVAVDSGTGQFAQSYPVRIRL